MCFVFVCCVKRGPILRGNVGEFISDIIFAVSVYFSVHLCCGFDSVDVDLML